MSTDDKYVEIARTFREVDEDVQSPFERKAFRQLRIERSLTWDKLIASPNGPTIVLLAPSGMGKTTEFKQRVMRLRAQGIQCLYAEARLIATEDWSESLDADDRHSYETWKTSNSSLLVFIDAVDELNLYQRRMSDLVRRLERAFDLTTRHVRFVFSARNGAWSREDTGTLTRLLKRSGEPKPLIKIVTFEPIDQEALCAIARNRGVTDIGRFLDEFENNELDSLLELRPCDVDLFVGYWNRHRKFGTWSSILADLIDNSLVDTAHTRTRAITQLEAKAGLERLAAAAALGNKIHIGLPSATEAHDVISARRLFADWPSQRLAELLELPLLVHKGTDAVQLPQGALSHFLASSWLLARVARGLTIELMRNVLLVQIPGEEYERIPGSRRQILGWAASAIPSFRSSILETHPDLAIYEGDPERLSDREVEQAIRCVVKCMALGRHMPSLTRGTLKKLARPSLERVIVELLKDHTGPDVRQLLLRFAEAGTYRSTVPIADNIARARDVDGYTRSLAVRIVISSGQQEVVWRLLELTSDADTYVREELLRGLAPEILKGAALVSFVASGGDHRFSHALDKIAELFSISVLDDILAAIAPILNSSTVTEQTESALNVALPVIRARLAASGSVTELVLELLLAVEGLVHYRVSSLPDAARSYFDQWFDARTDERRELWRRRISAAALDAHDFFHANPPFARLQLVDLPWLMSAMQDAGEREGQEAYFLAMRMCDELGTEGRRGLRSQDLSPELLALLNQRDEVDARFEQQKLEAESAQKASDDARRASNIEQLTPRSGEIRSGRDRDAIVFAWRALQTLPARDTKVEFDSDGLETLFGKDLANDLIQGFRAFWRQQKVEPRIPHADRFRDLYAAGLAGLALDVQWGLELTTLSLQESELAARYGLYARNGLPFWYESLAVAHVSAVRKALAEVISLEWDLDEEYHGVLGIASTASRPVALVLRDIVADLLAIRLPRNPYAVSCAADALLTSRDGIEKIAPVVVHAVNTEQDDSRLAEWLRIWAHYQPVDAATWLFKRVRGRKTAQRFAALVMAVAELLEQDLDTTLGRVSQTGLTAPRALFYWIQLLHLVVRPEEDVRQRGAYVPNTRDIAQDFRTRCLRVLAMDTSIEAGNVLHRLTAQRSMKRYGHLLSRLVDERMERVVESQRALWTEDDVLRMEDCDEKHPRTPEELFALVRRHLRVVRLLLENDDFSYRALFGASTSETHIQLWAASSLRQVARGLYSVVRENAVDDNKEVDISAFADGVGRVPIEIKPLNKRRYSYHELCKVIDEQLTGQYMQPREVSFGVLLLVYHERRHWTIAKGRQSGLSELVEALQRYANEAGRKYDKVIIVESIDALTVPTLRSINSSRPRSRPGTPVGADGQRARPGTSRRRWPRA